jgi:hypothetical protein
MMKHKERSRTHARHDRPMETATTLMGMFAGAAAGAIAGPAGLLVGALLGAAAGAAMGVAADRDEQRAAQRDEELDQDLGIEGGDIGVPNLKHPPPKVGAYSAAAAGAGASSTDDVEPAEGPMPPAG